MTLNDLNDAQFIALETFRKTGEGVITPVWVTSEAGKLYVWTGVGSGKIKRIRNNPRVRVCKSDGRGQPQSEWVEAQARLLDSPEAIAAAQHRLTAKYGRSFRLISMMQGLVRFVRRIPSDNIVIELA